MCDSGVVDQDVEARNLPSDTRERLPDAALVANVTVLGKHSNLIAGKLGFHFLETGLVASADDQIATFRSKRAGNGQADTLRGSSDQRGFSFQCGLVGAEFGQSDPVGTLANERQEFRSRFLLFTEAAQHR